MATSKVSVTEGVGKNAATYSVAEDAVTKEVQRVALNDSAGAAITTLPVNITATVPGTGATNLGKAEDAAHTTGDVGVMSLAVRNDAGTLLASTDLDYIPLSTNSSGALRVTGGTTEYVEDVAAAADPTGGVLLAVRRDTLSTAEVSADGDNIALKATSKGKLHVASEVRFGDVAADLGVGTGGSATQRITIDNAQLGSLGQAAMSASVPVAVATDQTWPTGLSPRSFAVTFATLTRPANTTAYSAADSISDNATAGSVTALVSGNISDTNDAPLTLTEIHVSSSDTGLAGKKLRAYVYNSNPTSSSGVGGGDNAAFSNKKAGYVGSFQGWMEAGFSDGSVGRLTPTYNETNYSPAGSFVVTTPVSGAKTLYIQYQAVEAFTPSANSTTIVGTIKGFQGRAT